MCLVSWGHFQRCAASWPRLPLLGAFKHRTHWHEALCGPELRRCGWKVGVLPVVNSFIFLFTTTFTANFTMMLCLYLKIWTIPLSSPFVTRLLLLPSLRRFLSAPPRCLILVYFNGPTFRYGLFHLVGFPFSPFRAAEAGGRATWCNLPRRDRRSVRAQLTAF